MSDEPSWNGAAPPGAVLPAPEPATVEGFLRAARDVHASDLHLSAGSVPWARVEGEAVRFDVDELAPEAAEALTADLLRRGGAERTLDGDFCFDSPGLGRFRANVHRQRRGWGASLKCIPLEILGLEELGLPEELYELTQYRVGLVLITGPTNSGKSSTLAALLDRVNDTRRDHVVTIEDPIEFVFESRGCNVTQRQVGPHTRTFSGALRAALREDPDVILVSELRDLDTIRTAIVAAETGHLVMGTLHTVDAATTLTRIVDAFPPKEQRQVRTMLAGSLRAVVSQRLLPRLGGGRRVAAYEILRVTTAVGSLIRDGKTHQIASQIQMGRRHGMMDFDTRLGKLVEEGLVSDETALEHARSPERFGGAAR